MAWRSERSMWSVDSVAAKVVVVQLASSRPVSPSFAPLSPPSPSCSLTPSAKGHSIHLFVFACDSFVPIGS